MASVAQFEPIRHQQTLVDFVRLEVECDIPESPRREGRSPTVEQGYLNCVDDAIANRGIRLRALRTLVFGDQKGRLRYR